MLSVASGATITTENNFSDGISVLTIAITTIDNAGTTRQRVKKATAWRLVVRSNSITHTGKHRHVGGGLGFEISVKNEDDGFIPQ